MVMGTVDFLLDRFRTASLEIALVEINGSAITYDALLKKIKTNIEILNQKGINAGDSVQLRGDFSANAVAWLIALWQTNNIVSPVAPSSYEKFTEFATIANAAWIIEAKTSCITLGPGDSEHPRFEALQNSTTPGLIIFSSGTTGTSKGALHNVAHLLGKFHDSYKRFTTAAFLLFDHIAGIDTLLYCLASTSRIICLPDRSPATVVDRIEMFEVEVLPTAPSFLNLLLLSNTLEGRNLSSLKIVTYGAEMMPQSLLERVNDAFPDTRVIQKYGTSEIGALRSQSQGGRSRWISIGGEGTKWRVIEGLLEVKTQTAMLGYLNAPSPFTPDGWYKTGDRVEEDGDFIRFLGRESDIINVGGQKVFPAEVEDAIREIDGVAEVVVFGKPHPILGALVCARVRMFSDHLTLPEIRSALRTNLAGKIEPYKIPQKIEVARESLTTERFKQRRE